MSERCSGCGAKSMREHLRLMKKGHTNKHFYDGPLKERKK